MWRPQKLPATLTLAWERPFAMGEVRLTFDTFTRVYTDMPFESGKRAAPQCVSVFNVVALRDGVAVKTIRVEGNYHRVVSLDMAGAEADALAITLEQTCEPGHLPGVYDVRVLLK